MNQENIGKYIKKLRKENNLSQEKLADKLGVTYQAVSKWERGLNLPDMTTLKEISNLFNVNIDDIINGENPKKIKLNNKIYIIVITVLIFLILIGIIYFSKNNTYSVNDIASTNNNFKVVGTFIKSNNKTNLIINSVDYKGEKDNTKYKKLSCDLVEIKGNFKEKVSSCKSITNSTLKEYLENVDIKMDYSANNCTMFSKSKLTIEIQAELENDKLLTYNIPLEVNKNSCS